MRRLKKRLSNKTHVIWDWNGTIVDDVDLCVEIIAEIATRHGLNPIDKEEYLRKFRFPVSEYYRDIGFTDKIISPKDLTHQFISSYGEKLPRLSLHHGMVDLLLDIHALGIKQSILSAAHETDLRRLLVHFEISQVFTYVFGLNNHDAHGKIERGLDLIAQIDEPPGKIVLIGDTLHDQEVAEKLGIESIILSGGHQHPEFLTKVCSSYVLRNEI